jgi:hypothetical protein
MQSYLRTVLEEVYTTRDLDVAKKTVVTALESPQCPIHKRQAFVMKKVAEGQKTLAGLQQYVTNSFLRFEGMGV